jgi:hypothetical protein
MKPLAAAYAIGGVVAIIVMMCGSSWLMALIGALVGAFWIQVKGK